MATPDISPGVAIRYPGTGPKHDPGRPHTFVIVGEDVARGDILIVAIISANERSDRTCVILPEEWEEIRWESIVGYYHFKTVYKPNIIRSIEEGVITYLGVVPDTVYLRIKEGVTLSPDVEPLFLKRFENMDN